MMCKYEYFLEDFSNLVWDGWTTERYNKACESYLKTFKNKSNSLFNVSLPEIKNVIFNAPATIIFWGDNTKTVTKADGEDYDMEKGMAMCIAKKALGNQGNYYEVFKKWVGEDVLFAMRNDQKSQD